MKQTNVIEHLGNEKMKGILCWLCQKDTGSRNIPICVDCCLNEQLLLSLPVFKKLLSTDTRYWQPQTS